MTSFLVETEDLAQVAKSVHDGGGAVLEATLERLLGTLGSCGGMAGNDPAGTQWAADYDAAARTTLRATQSATNSVYHLAAMFAQTARNYEAAEQASTAAPGRPALDPLLLPDTVVSWGADVPPSACGDGASGPPGWSLVMHLVHTVWPNGHQDRLHTAAAAWQASAAALDQVAEQVQHAPAPLERDRLPEQADVRTVCRTVADRLSELAYAHRTLGRACIELADHIDEAHSAIEHELVSLAEWSAGIQIVGGLFSVVTLGAAEAPTQAEQAARIAATAAKISTLIERFAALARAAAEALPSVSGWSESLARAMDEFVNGRLAVAEVTAVRTLPPPASVEGISATEMAAEERLASEAATTAPTLRRVEIGSPQRFEPDALRGMAPEDVRASIPSEWLRGPSARGGGEVYRDPAHPGRAIRIMPGYRQGSRPDLINSGPYAVVSQNGLRVKIPLRGNPVLHE